MLVLTRTEAQLSDESGVTGTKPVAELGDEGLQILSSLFWRVDVPEEIAQSIGEELVAEIMEGHQLVQNIPPAHKHRLNGIIAWGHSNSARICHR